MEVFGKACHSSIIEQGINAINIMAQLVIFIENEQKRFVGITSNCGVIAGGDIINRVPDYCKLKFDVRSTSSKQVYYFLKLILEKIKILKYKYKTKIKIKKTLEIPPLEIKNEKIINNIAAMLNLNIRKFMGGCEAGYYQKLGGDAIVFGVGDMSLAHKPNEYVNINEYKKYNELFMNLLKEIAKKYYN